LKPVPWKRGREVKREIFFLEFRSWEKGEGGRKTTQGELLTGNAASVGLEQQLVEKQGERGKKGKRVPLVHTLSLRTLLLSKGGESTSFSGHSLGGKKRGGGREKEMEIMGHCY